MTGAVNVIFALVSVYGRSMPATDTSTQFRNPFNFWSVLGMAATMGILILAGRVMNDRYGATGAVASAAAMGFFDVDAMTVSMTRLMSNGLGPREAAYALLSGVASNALTKVAISATFGQFRLAVRISAVTLVCVLVGWGVLRLTLAYLAQ